MSALERMRAAVAENQRASASRGQLDLAGDVDTTARYDDCTGDRLKLFEPAPEQMAGQEQMDLSNESEDR